MQITCPSCASKYDLTAAVNDASARRFAALMGGLQPAVARHIPAYLGLFKPASQGLRWSRMLTLLEDIEPEIRAARVERNGRDWVAPPALWADAMQTMIDKRGLKLPLKGHGYLREIVASLANSAEGRAEAQAEDAKRQRGAARPTGGGPSAPRHMGDHLAALEARSRAVAAKELGLDD